MQTIATTHELSPAGSFPRQRGVRQRFRGACAALAERHSDAAECAPCKGVGMGAMLANRPPTQLPPRFALPLISMGEGVAVKQIEQVWWTE